MDWLTNSFPEHTMYILGWILVHAVWQLAVIGLMLYLSLKIFNSSSSAFKYRLCIWALAGAFGASLLTGVVLSDGFGSTELANASGFEQRASKYHDNYSQAIDPMPTTWALWIQKIENQLPILVRIWFFGTVLFMIRFAGNVAEIRNLKKLQHQAVSSGLELRLKQLMRKMGLTRTVKLLVSIHVDVPMTYGTLKPVILFPATLLLNMPMLQLEAILAHELAHIKRNDFAVNLLQALLEVLFFFHPVFWWINRCSQEFRESACDEMAIAAGIEPRQLAFALAEVVNLHAKPIPSPALAAHKKDHPTLDRIKQILGIRTTHKNPTILTTMTMMISLLLCATIWAGAGDKRSSEANEAELAAYFPTYMWEQPLPLDSIPPIKSERKNDSIPAESPPYPIMGFPFPPDQLSDQWTLLFKNPPSFPFEADRMPKLEMKGLPPMPNFDYKDFPTFDLMPIPPLMFEMMPDFGMDFPDFKIVPPSFPNMDSVMKNKGLHIFSDTTRRLEWTKEFQERMQVWQQQNEPKMKEFESRIEQWQKQNEPKLKEFEKRMEQWQKENEPKIKAYESKLKIWEVENEPKMKEFEERMKQWQAENEPKMEVFQKQMEAWQEKHEEKLKEFQQKMEQWEKENELEVKKSHKERNK
jgi:bla regulator protein blaR1